MDPKDIGARLKQIREAAGLSMSEVAKRVGLSGSSAIAHIESGHSPPPVERLASIAEACGVRLRIDLVPADLPDDDPRLACVRDAWPRMSEDERDLLSRLAERW